MQPNQEIQENSPHETTIDAGVAKTGNVVIIGLPASGKSSIGLFSSQIMGKGFIDLDAWIEEQAKSSINDIFERLGEQGFRDMESEAVKQLAGVRNHVISVGSGAVEDTENWKRLRQLGITVFLLTPPEVLVRRIARSARELEKRPLFEDLTTIEGESERLEQVKQRLEQLYERRAERFQGANIIVLNGLGTAEFVAQSLAREVEFKVDSHQNR